MQNKRESCERERGGGRGGGGKRKEAGRLRERRRECVSEWKFAVGCILPAMMSVVTEKIMFL